jgi:hypothetical protein
VLGSRGFRAFPEFDSLAGATVLLWYPSFVLPTIKEVASHCTPLQTPAYPVCMSRHDAPKTGNEARYPAPIQIWRRIENNIHHSTLLFFFIDTTAFVNLLSSSEVFLYQVV